MFEAIGKARRRASTEQGFTIVELTIVIIVSTIMVAGMVGLVVQSFTLFGTQKDLEAVSESSRRVLSAMARQMRGTLRVDDANTGATSYGFWADIDYDDPAATSEASHYEEAERVIFYRDATNSRVMQHTDQPDDSPRYTNLDPITFAREASLGSYVSNLQFYYFAPGYMPQSSAPSSAPFANSVTGSNASVGSVIIVLTMQKGKATRVYQQQVFLRITTRA